VGISILLFCVILGFAGWDVIHDYRIGMPWGHIAVEFTMFLTAATGAALLSWSFLNVRSRARVLEHDLETARRDAARWRVESRECLEGLGAAIERQFVRWKLTPAEADVGLLLLKGLSHREVAEVRRTSDRTVREQARSLYRKAGLAGRSELSAFFLEDLLLPRADRTSRSPIAR
jgi:DNA-binding CsgD family transcriptional regulator